LHAAIVKSSQLHPEDFFCRFVTLNPTLVFITAVDSYADDSDFSGNNFYSIFDIVPQLEIPAYSFHDFLVASFDYYCLCFKFMSKMALDSNKIKDLRK
jgi:hypothetical protein